MPIMYLLQAWWLWFLDTGLTITILIVCAFLVPRIGRFIVRVLTNRIEGTDDASSRLAITGTMVYIAEVVAYFVILVMILQQLGFSLAGATIPATVISAAIGLGAQSIIADFLAGFFVLSEKQYGVGDWVKFKGNGVDVEGDVMNITMRATRIRTLKGESVLVPNSVARVCINNSGPWARTVVEMPVPLLGSNSVHDAINRSTEAAQEVVKDPHFAPDVFSDLDVHPATAIVPPVTVGMPWMVTMRFICQVNPARQWAIEREIRTAILEEFWEEYGSATTTTGAVRDQLTSEFPDYTAQLLIDAQRAREGRDPSQVGLPDDAFPDTTEWAPHRLPTRPEPGETEVEGKVPSRTDVSVEDPPEIPLEDPLEVRTVFRNLHTTSMWARLLSIGGRVRPSTTALFLILFGLLLLKGLTFQPASADAANSGWLAPKPAVTSEVPASSQQVPTTKEVAPEETVEPAQSTPATGETPKQQEDGSDPIPSGSVLDNLMPPGRSKTTTPTPVPTAPAPVPSPADNASQAPTPNAGDSTPVP